MPRSNNKPKRKVAKLPFPTQNQKNKEFEMRQNELRAEIQQHGKNIEALSKNHDLQIALLGNFATHDLKNYLHSIDGIVSTYTAEEITEEQMDSIRYNVNLMREALSNFSKLVIHNGDNVCKLDDLIHAIKILNRDAFSEQNIDFDVIDQVERDIVFHIPFISMVQLLNNLIINAAKALESRELDKKIEIQASLSDTHLIMKVFDNGAQAEQDLQSRLFDFGFSTTGGSGIGLYHARYLCKLYKGSIDFQQSADESFKGFIITLPLMEDQ